jgi:hypothetical protein
MRPDAPHNIRNYMSASICSFSSILDRMCVILYVFVWEECVAVCVALFADLNVLDRTAWAAAGPGSDPHGEVSELRLCVCDKAKRHTAFY